MRRLAVAMVLVLAGCATAAQRQARQTGEVAQKAGIELKSCIQSVRARPEFNALTRHLPVTGEPTMAQLTDETFPSPEETSAFSSMHDNLTLCREAFLQSLSKVRPDVVPIFSSSYLKTTNDAIELVEHKITWGKYLRQVESDAGDMRQKLATADQHWGADLAASHRAEMADRQAAANAVLQYSAQMQAINAMNRPVVTNCSTFGPQVNCISR